MAASPSHKLGQLIGHILEDVFTPRLQELASESGLYLDAIGKKRKARKSKKLTWEDAYGSLHDLDFVLELGGSEDAIGRPVAFIESAWRRYTKHSKNKAQEIQGAILPIAEKYNIECPFKGAILAGEFTAPSLEQLTSCGFTVLYIQYSSIVNAFKSVGIDMSFGENTSEKTLLEKVTAIENLPKEVMGIVKDAIINDNHDAISTFIKSIKEKIEKVIDYILITPLYGKEKRFTDINSVRIFIAQYEISKIPEDAEFNRFVVTVKYINNDKIEANFSSVSSVNDFLNLIIHS